MKIYSYDGVRKYLFGDLKDNGVLLKTVDRKKHYLKVVSGYAVQKDVYDTYDTSIKEIVFDEGDRCLTISADDFKANRKTWTKGFGTQYTISEKFMVESMRGVPSNG